MQAISTHLVETGFVGEKYKDTRLLAEKLYRKVLRCPSFTTEEKVRIAITLQVVLEAHYGQADREDGNPYVTHPLDVGTKALDQMDDPKASILMAALLHDTVEDRPAELIQSIQKRFPIRVSKRRSIEDNALTAVEALTGSRRARKMVGYLTNPNFKEMVRDKNTRDMLIRQGILTGEEDLITAKNILYTYQVKEAIKDPEVAFIKLCDFTSNISTLSKVANIQRRIGFINKYYPVIDIFLNRLESTYRPLNIKPGVKKKYIEMLNKKKEEMLLMKKAS